MPSSNDVASQLGLPDGARRLKMPVNLIGRPAFLDGEAQSFFAIEKVPIDPHGPEVPE
jgi:hypothetical protein